jgi:hypothetical protein
MKAVDNVRHVVKAQVDEKSTTPNRKTVTVAKNDLLLLNSKLKSEGNTICPMMRQLRI